MNKSNKHNKKTSKNHKFKSDQISSELIPFISENICTETEQFDETSIDISTDNILNCSEMATTDTENITEELTSILGCVGNIEQHVISQNVIQSVEHEHKINNTQPIENKINNIQPIEYNKNEIMELKVDIYHILQSVNILKDKVSNLELKIREHIDCVVDEKLKIVNFNKEINNNDITEVNFKKYDNVVDGKIDEIKKYFDINKDEIKKYVDEKIATFQNRISFAKRCSIMKRN